VERIISYVTEKTDSAANGVALFTCWGAEEFFEAIQLTTPVNDNRVYAYNQPDLFQLAHLDEQYPRYAARCSRIPTRRVSSSSGWAMLQEQEAKTAEEKVRRLMQQYRARGLAVVGLQETLDALANGQVQAFLAPEIPDSKGGTESEEPREVTKAKQTGATVTFVEDVALLESAGGVGAFLRWRA
jgi:hypothetical protein